jgi:hypothetical protein
MVEPTISVSAPVTGLIAYPEFAARVDRYENRIADLGKGGVDDEREYPGGRVDRVSRNAITQIRHIDELAPRIHRHRTRSFSPSERRTGDGRERPGVRIDSVPQNARVVSQDVGELGLQPDPQSQKYAQS